MESKYLSAKNIAKEAAERIRDSISFLQKKKKIISVGLSGGSSPKALYEELKKILSPDEIRQTAFFLIDERYVPENHPDSNLSLVKKHLINELPVSPRVLIHPLTFLPLGETVAQYEKDLLPYAPFDIAILGIGTDGHTASLFPDEDFLSKSPRLTLETPMPHQGHKRITLSFKALEETKELFFYVPSQEKKVILDEIMKHPSNYPAGRLILRHDHPVIFKEK